MVCVGLAIYVKLSENRLIFYPSRKLNGAPRVPFENVAFTADDGTREQVAGIILEAPFTSVAAVARKIVHVPIGFLFSTRFDSLSKIREVKAPVVVIHATTDPVIPFELGLQLFKAIVGPKDVFHR